MLRKSIEKIKLSFWMKRGKLKKESRRNGKLSVTSKGVIWDAAGIRRIFLKIFIKLIQIK